MSSVKQPISIEGFAYALRPACVSDATLVVELRADAARARFLHPIEATVLAQEEYLERQLDRDGDYYFVIQRRGDGYPEGLVGIYGIDALAQSAEWGRWILRAGSIAAIESALLIYRVAFERLGLAEVTCRTVACNASVVSFHDTTGLKRRATLRDHFQLGAERFDAIEHVLTRGEWPRVFERLSRLAQRLAATSRRR